MYNSLLTAFVTVADCAVLQKPRSVVLLHLTYRRYETDQFPGKPSGPKDYKTNTALGDSSDALPDRSSIKTQSFYSIFLKNQSPMPDRPCTVRTAHSMWEFAFRNPAKPFMDLWYRVNEDFPGYKLHLVPFDDDHKGILSEISQLGEKFDVLIGVCDSKIWLNKCHMLPLGRYKKMCAVSKGNTVLRRKRS